MSVVLFKHILYEYSTLIEVDISRQSVTSVSGTSIVPPLPNYFEDSRKDSLVRIQ